MTYYLVIGLCIFLLLAVIYFSIKPISMGIEARRNLKEIVEKKDIEENNYISDDNFISEDNNLSEINGGSPDNKFTTPGGSPAS